MRIDRSTVPKGRYQYEVADDDENHGDLARVQRGVLINFFGTRISDVPLPFRNDSVLWLHDRDYVYL